LSGQPNPTLKGATFEETEANIARDDEQRVARAARYADELLNDPATPAEIKQRVADMGGDYANPDNQSFVAHTLVAQRGGEKITKAVQDLVDLGKSAFAKGSEAAGEGLSAAKKAVGDAATAAQDRIVKKNLQSATPAEQAAFGKVVFDGLTDEAKVSIIVHPLDDVKKAMTGLLDKKKVEKFLGRAEVRQTFNVPKIGTIAGSAVIDGKILRGANVRLLRDSRIIFDGKMSSLKRFKDDAKEVATGYECGIGIENYNDLKPGDIIEAYQIDMVAPELHEA
jgi:translation initiation factor IF-2